MSARSARTASVAAAVGVAPIEAACARLVGTPAALSFVSCWNANEAVPGTLLGEEDIVISDQLNHASIIDGVRLAKAITKCQTAVYRHADLADLEEKLTAARDRRVRLVVTDGIFSMEGAIAKLPDLLELCRKHHAVLMVDDSHATGVLGATGRGTAEHFGMLGDVDIITSTLGKALGGAAGGFVAASAATCDYLTQRARPQLFSNALPPTVAASSLASIEYLEAHPERVTRLREQAPISASGCSSSASSRSRRDAHHPGDPGRDLGGHPDERPAAFRRRVRHRLRLSGGAPGSGPRALPDLRGPHQGRPRSGPGRVRESRQAVEGDMS